MVETYRKDINPLRFKYAEDYRNGMNFTEIGKKYGVNEFAVANAIKRCFGYIERERITGKPMRIATRRLYETKFMTIAQGVVDECGLMELASRVGVTLYVLDGILHDLVSEENYDRILHRKYRSVYTDEFKKEVRKAWRSGMSHSKIRNKFRICYPTIDKIVNEEQ